MNIKGLKITDIMDMDWNDLNKLTPQEMKQVTSRLVSAANKRIRRLEKAPRGTESFAYQVVEERGRKFSVKGKNTNQLRNEFKNVRAFLKYKTSTTKGWKQYREKMEQRVSGATDGESQQWSERTWSKFWKVYRRIEEKHVRKVCSLSPAARIFDLTDAVTRGDTGSALKLLHALTDGQERDRGSALGVLTMLFRNWENILKVKLLLAEGFSESEIQKITAQKPYPVKKQCEQSRKLSFDELRKKLRYLMDLDQAIKSGNIDESLALSLAVSG